MVHPGIEWRRREEILRYTLWQSKGYSSTQKAITSVALYADAYFSPITERISCLASISNR
jgi:hypothetical protein